MMYIKIENKDVKIQLPRWLLVSFWSAATLAFAHVGKTYLELQDVKSELAVCRQKVSDIEQKLNSLLPDNPMPGNRKHDGAGAPRTNSQ